MSRRARAIAFAALAAVCAALAAGMADRYGARVAQSYGPLRDVVVAASDLPAARPLDQAEIARSLQLRRIPARFVPPGALTAPVQALGQAPSTPLVAGSYVLSNQLRPPGAERRGGARRLGLGRRPVEIAISGGGALEALGGSARESRVDVVVTTEPRAAGAGRSYVAAEGVRLLALARQDPAGPGPATGWSATLALTRDQALRLIEAESFARSVRLLPRPAG